MSSAQIYYALLSYLIVVASLTLHEWGHAMMADRLGDDTPRSQGRVTLNPIAHIDLVGTVILPLLGIFSGFPLIGWAKPVYINPDNLPKTADRAWVTIAGPGMNLILALATTVALALLHRFSPSSDLRPLLELILRINVGLMVFNLLPVPPLDGSKFLMYWFGMKEETYEQFSRFGWIILMVLINLPQTRGFLGALIHYSMQPFKTIESLLT
jgi:Zn-dependent protease